MNPEEYAENPLPDTPEAMKGNWANQESRVTDLAERLEAALPKSVSVADIAADADKFNQKRT